MNLRHLIFLCTIFVILRHATSQFANGETTSEKAPGPGSNAEEQGFLIYSVSQRFLNAMDNFFEKWNKNDEQGSNKNVVREQGKRSDTNIFTRTRGDFPRSYRQEPRQGDPAVGSKTKAFRGSSRFENKATTNLRATTTKKKAMIMSSSSTSSSSSSSSMGMSSSIGSSVSMMGSSNMMGSTASVAQPIGGPFAQPANMSEKGDIIKNVTAPIVQPVFQPVNFPTPFPTGIPPTPYPTGVRSIVQPQVVAPFDAPVFQQIHQPSVMPQYAKITLSPSVTPLRFPTSIASPSENFSRPPSKFFQSSSSVSPSDTPSVTDMATYPSFRFPTINPSETPSSLSSSQTSSLSPIFRFPTINPSGAPSPSSGAQISLEPIFRFPTINPSGAPSPTSSQRTTDAPAVSHLTSIRLLDFRVIADAVSSGEDLRSETEEYLTVAFRAAAPGFVQLELVERDPFRRRAHRALQTQVVLYFGGTAFYGFGSVVTTEKVDDAQVASLTNITSFQLYLDGKLGSSAPKLFDVVFEPTPFPTQSPTPLPTTAIQTIITELPSIPPGNATEGPRTDRPTTNAPSAAPTSPPATEAPMIPAPGNPTEAPTVADAFLLLPTSSPPTTVAPTPNPSTNNAAPSSFPSNLPSTSPSSTTVSPFRPSNAPSATFVPSTVPSNLPTTSTVDRSSAPSIS